MKDVEKKLTKNIFTEKEKNIIIKKRLEDNLKLFNDEEINVIKNNKNLVEKIYLLGILDSF